MYFAFVLFTCCFWLSFFFILVFNFLVTLVHSGLSWGLSWIKIWVPFVAGSVELTILEIFSFFDLYKILFD